MPRDPEERPKVILPELVAYLRVQNTPRGILAWKT